MATKLIRTGLAALAVFGLVAMSAGNAKTEDAPIPIDKEFLSGPEAIKNAAQYGAPIAVWEALEHGERVECLDCIPYVEPLLFNKDARIREIAAWWIRRRPFGYAEIALRIRKTIAEDADPDRRAAAANALGEFLDGGATKILVKAAGDTSPAVRVAVMGAIRRLNDAEGIPAISTLLHDGDVKVRVAALEAAIHVGGFNDTAGVATLLSDADPVVRTKASNALGQFKARGSVAGLAAMSKNDTEEEVRIAAVNSLGELGDASGRSAVEAALADPSSRVRDAAKVAQIKLSTAL
ncbi:MAG: HEAT repeat domain-containing protein [Polyangiales bacterium]